MLCRSMRVHFLAEANFVRPTDNNDTNCGGGGDWTSQATSCIRGYFHTRPVHVSAASAMLSFNMHHSKFPFDFYLVADFE